MAEVHVSRDGTSFGPYAEDVFRQYVAEGRILPTDLFWQEGMKEWEPVGGGHWRASASARLIDTSAQRHSSALVQKEITGMPNERKENLFDMLSRSGLIIAVVIVTLELSGKFQDSISAASLCLAASLVVLSAVNAIQKMKSDENMGPAARVVTDVYEALNTAGTLTIGILVLGLVIGVSMGAPYAGAVALLALLSKYIGRVFAAQYVGIILDQEMDILSLQGSELDNGFLDVITLRAARNKMHRESLKLSDIEGVYCETRRWTTKQKDSNNRTTTRSHVKYCLNIAGPFGSRHVEFSSKQKRDEGRSTILNCAKNVSASPISDVAVDLG
jgi:hypothetical protein